LADPRAQQEVSEAECREEASADREEFQAAVSEDREEVSGNLVCHPHHGEEGAADA
jgi:hypothetical protein